MASELMSVAVKSDEARTVWPTVTCALACAEATVGSEFATEVSENCVGLPKAMPSKAETWKFTGPALFETCSVRLARSAALMKTGWPAASCVDPSKKLPWLAGGVWIDRPVTAAPPDTAFSVNRLDALYMPLVIRPFGPIEADLVTVGPTRLTGTLW